MLRRMLRLLWKVCKWTLLVAVALMALVVVINWRDEPLSDEARALLAEQPPANHVPDRENILVAMAGIKAPEGADVFEAGRRYMEQTARQGESAEQEQKLTWKETEPPFDCTISMGDDFLQCAELERGRLAETLAFNKTLVARYRAMQRLPHYAAIQDPGTWVVDMDFGTPFTIRKFLLAQAMLDIKDGNTDAGLEFFKKDMALWRKNLDGKFCLLDSMFATAWLMQDARGVSMLLSLPTKGEQQQEWRALLAPLSPGQQSLHAAWEGEIKFNHNYAPELKRWKSYHEVSSRGDYNICDIFSGTMEKCPAWQAWLEENIQSIFLQPNASFNDNIPFYKTWLKLTDLSWKDYLAQRDVMLAPFKKPAKLQMDWIYNPVGKKSSTHLMAPAEYIGRLHDADTYLRLIRLQLELRLAEMLSGQVADFLKQLDAPYCAPCSDFSWDAQTRQLSFHPCSEQLAGWVPPSATLPEPAAPAH